MTIVTLAPRAENPDSSTESILSIGWWQIRPARDYWDGTQDVRAVWTARRKFTGAAVSLDLDALTDVPYELYMEVPDGRGGYLKTTEFRLVPAGGPVNWQACTLVDGPGANPVPTNVVNARLDALEAANPSGGATNLAGITDMSAFMRTVNDDTSAAAALTTLGAAPIASPTFTGTPAAPTPTAGDADTSIATTAFVDTSFAKKASPTFTGTPAAPTAAGGTNTTQIATTAFVQSAMTGSFNSANPTFTGTTDVVNLDVSGSTAFAAGSIAQAAVTNLTTDLAAKVAAAGAQSISGVKTSADLWVFPTTAPSTDGQVAVKKYVDDAIAAAFTARAVPLYLMINYTTGVWPARTIPAGHTGIVLWWSLGYANATLPAGMVNGDFWMRNYPA